MLIPHDGISAEFLAHWLDSAQDALAALTDEAGHGTKRLPTERWQNLKVATPPRDEQDAIAKFPERSRAIRSLQRKRAWNVKSRRCKSCGHDSLPTSSPARWMFGNVPRH